ncbi:ImmA/IrrE family metallo-endopeptidase [Lactobacillus gallinarum]|uniref:ImmA/IrrE family metallo-endopeptidase n=1 Tax=Lactobacillus gallinarum TaxID=52242 RepID=UPI0024B1EB05|nr:ImmA/IrrE family metallo-endopeptidase [Lactobacillus gallinarum]
MVSATYAVKNDVLKWVLETSNDFLSDKWKNKINIWLTGKKQPTIVQIRDLSKASHISFGDFFLDTPPKSTLLLLNYRTINNSKVINPSRDLLDVINQMELKADWLQDYYRSEGLDKLSFVGQGRIENNLSVEEKAKKILAYFDLVPGWNMKEKNAFNFLKNKLGNARIAVILGSHVGRQNQRTLNIEEFRAFVLVNAYAPLIFINTRDNQNARLFSLVHELVHIWMGDTELFNNNFSSSPQYLKPTSEQEINKIVEQILFPKDIFIKIWGNISSNDTDVEHVYGVAKKFHTSPIAAAIAAKRYRLIDQKTIIQIKKETAKNTEKRREKQKKSKSRPPYYDLVWSNLDPNFARSVINSTESGQSSYTEAFSLLGVSGNKGYQEIKDRLEER